MSRGPGSRRRRSRCVSAALFCEREERFGGFFRDEGQVDVFSGERPLVGAAEQEQCFGEVDRSGVDGVETVDELAVVVARIVAGDVEQRLRDRQRRAQLVGGVGCESFSRCCSATCASSRASMASKASASSRNSSLRPSSWIRWESDPVAAMRVASVMRVRGASMRPARNQPPSRPNTSRNASTMAAIEPKPCSGSERSNRNHHEGCMWESTPSGM